MAFVVAETRDAARNAAEAVVVDYDVLPAVVDAAAALRDGAPQLWDQAPGNLSYRFQKGDAAAVQAAIAGAAHVVELALINNRIVISALEPRGAIGALRRCARLPPAVLRRRRARAAIATGRDRVPRAGRSACASPAPMSAAGSA